MGGFGGGFRGGGFHGGGFRGGMSGFRGGFVGPRFASRRTERLLSASLGIGMAVIAEGGVLAIGMPVWSEYFDAAVLPDGGRLLLVTTVVEDPQYLQTPFIVSSQFKKESDGSKWDPTPCTAK